jgi:hypothetical protein
MKTAAADSNCFREFGKLHSLIISSERTPSVSPVVLGRDYVTAALAESHSPSIQIAQFHRKGDST